jgi:hypothetical protein
MRASSAQIMETGVPADSPGVTTRVTGNLLNVVRNSRHPLSAGYTGTKDSANHILEGLIS